MRSDEEDWQRSLFWNFNDRRKTFHCRWTEGNKSLKAIARPRLKIPRPKIAKLKIDDLCFSPVRATVTVLGSTTFRTGFHPSQEKIKASQIRKSLSLDWSGCNTGTRIVLDFTLQWRRIGKTRAYCSSSVAKCSEFWFLLHWAWGQNKGVKRHCNLGCFWFFQFFTCSGIRTFVVVGERLPYVDPTISIVRKLHA